MRSKTRALLLPALLGSIVAGCSIPPPNSTTEAPPPDRRIALYNTETGDRVDTHFRRNGQYDPEALTAIAQVLRDRRTGEPSPLDPALLDLLSDIVARLDLPDSTEIHISSGYRSPSTNALLARTNAFVADDSYHLRGQAVDMKIPGVPLKNLAATAADLGRGGFALYASHVHVDTGPARTWGIRQGDEPYGTVLVQAKPAKPVQVASRKSAGKAATEIAQAPKGKSPALKPPAKPNSRILLAKAQAVPLPPAKPSAKATSAKTDELKRLTVKPTTRKK